MKTLLITLIAITVFVVSAQSQIPSYVPTNGMIGWWPFDGNANDLSPNGNDGTVYGATPANDRNGTPDAAYAFDGLDDYIEVLPATAISSQVFSVSIWFYQNETFGEIEFVCLGDGNGTAWGCTAGNDNFKVNYGRGCSGTGSSPINGAVQLQNWHHVVYISAGVGGQSTIYLDGALLGQSSNSIGVGSCPSSILYFGVDIFSSPEIINGVLDDVGIWDRTLTEEEVTSLHSGESTGDITSGEGTDNGGVEVYPNPANGRYNLMLGQMEGVVNAKVYDTKGREVWSDALVANGTHSQHSIDLTEQAKGIYTLQLQYSQGTLTRKLVKN